ncbi:MAG: LysR family transcriptional regulator [Arenicella sp.]
MRYDLNLLKAFDALYKEQNVTRAAERINISQPAMSAVLTRLRDLFHDPLFIRDKFGMSPTEKAKSIHPTIEKALDDIDSIVLSEQVLDLSKEKRTFEIAANDYFQVVILPALMTRIRENAPFLKVITRPYLQDLAESGIMAGQTDLAFGRVHEPPNNLVVRQVMSENIACLAWKNNTKINEQLTLALFEELQHVIVKPLGKLKTGIFRTLKEQHIKRDIACSVLNFHGLPSLIEGTDYIALLPRHLCLEFTKNSQLTMYELPEEIKGFQDFNNIPFHLAWHRRYQKDPAHQWLRQQIIECCDENNRRMKENDDRKQPT